MIIAKKQNIAPRTYLVTVPVDKISSVKNAQACFSIVSYLKKYMEIKILKRKKILQDLGAV